MSDYKRHVFTEPQYSNLTLIEYFANTLTILERVKERTPETDLQEFSFRMGQFYGTIQNLIKQNAELEATIQNQTEVIAKQTAQIAKLKKK